MAGIMENTQSELANPEIGEAEQTPHMPWDELVTDFQKGGLTPAQYAAFALGGAFIVLLIAAIILAIHATRRAHAIEAEASMAATGRWKDTERDFVKTLPEPPTRRHRSQSGKGGGGVMGHIRRYSEDSRIKRQRQRSESRDIRNGRFI